MNTKHFKTISVEREAPALAQTGGRSRLEIKLDGFISLFDVAINAQRQLDFAK